MFKLATISKGDLARAKGSDKVTVFLGGECPEGNGWREGLKRAFPDILFLDPYDPDWDPEKNIYDELAGALGADYCVFYKGGEGTAKEQKLLDYLGYGYEDFDALEPLQAWLKGLEKPPVRKALADTIRFLVAKNYPFADVGADKVVINDFDAVPEEVWEKYARAMLALDYDYRGAQDAKELTKRSMKGDTVTLTGDHAKAFKQAIGAKDLYKPTGTPKGIVQKAIKEFGVTEDARSAGYILQDGQMLNMSERAGRELDHRSIERVFKEVKWTDAMRKFMAMGNIRLQCTDRTIDFDIRTRPTPAQVSTMKSILRNHPEPDVVVDAAGVHKEYENRGHGEGREMGRGTGIDELIMSEIQEAF